jgi:hypothetical protein
MTRPRITAAPVVLIGNNHEQKHDAQRFRLPLLGYEISVAVQVPQSGQTKHAHTSPSSGLDVDHPFDRVVGLGHLGGNQGAIGSVSALGICDDCDRAPRELIGDWRRADLDGPRISPAHQRDQVINRNARPAPGAEQPRESRLRSKIKKIAGFNLIVNDLHQ